jgi:uncharacterized protein YjaZ
MEKKVNWLKKLKDMEEGRKEMVEGFQCRLIARTPAIKRHDMVKRRVWKMKILG